MIQQALVQRALGFTCRVLGQWEEAIEWYRRCQETAKEMGKEGAWLYADTQNSEGYVYALMGRYEEANTLIGQALKLRQQLNLRTQVGQSYSAWGEVNRFAGDFRSANRHYDQALAVFEQERDPEWQAIVLQQRGENTRRIAVKMRTHGDEEGAQKWLEYSLENLEGSLALYERYNLSRGRSMLLRRLGRALRDVGRREEAEVRVQESYQMASHNADLREQLECLNVLAILALLKDDFNGVMQHTQPLLEVESRMADYLVFRGRAHILRGKAHAANQEWDKALDEFAIGLVNLGRSIGYGRERLEARIGDLTEILDDLPDVAIKRTWCTRLIETWERENLDNELPRLVELCRRYEETLHFWVEE